LIDKVLKELRLSLVKSW